MNHFIKTLVIAGSLIGMTALTSPAPVVNATEACIDGNARSSWDATWKGNDTITVTPKKALCKDTNVNFSSYVMPDDYNGEPFSNNPTATPQTIFGHADAVAKKGSTTPITLSIKLPETCKNMQIDAYWGEKVSNVTPKGHGTVISAKIIEKTSEACAPVTPETPATPVVVPETPVTPEAPAVETPAVLPSTGPAESIMQLVGATSLVGTSIAYIRSRR